MYQKELLKSKRNFYTKRIKALRRGKPGKWYAELKKLTNFEQMKTEEIIVDEIKDLTDLEQAERIADQFSKVANQYDPLKTEDISIPCYSEEEIPQFNETDENSVLNDLDTNKSNVHGDFPSKLLKMFSKFLTKPIKDLLNRDAHSKTISTSKY